MCTILRCLLVTLGMLLPGLATFAQPNTLVLSDTDRRFDLNSATEASGFFACEDFVALADNHLPEINSTRPDFRKHKIYCLSIPIRNETTQAEWVLHVSHFFFKEIRIQRASDDDSYKVSSNRYNSSLYNVLGLALPIYLAKGESYALIVELTSDRLGQPPYIAVSYTHLTLPTILLV